MRRSAGLLLIVAVAVAGLAGYMLRGSPTSVSGGEPVPLATDADTEVWAIIAQIEEQEALTTSAALVVPTPVPAPPPAPVVAGSAVVQPSPDPNEQDELRAIDAYAATERQKIEAWYADEVAKLKTSLEQRMQHLSEVDKLAWAQFYQRANETWSTTSGYDSGSSYDYGYGFSHDSGWRSETTRTRVVGDPAGDYAAIVAQIKNSRRATQGDFAKAQKELDRLRQNKLAGVQAEVDRRQMEVSRRKAAIALRKARADTETARREAGDLTPRVEAVMGGAGGQYQALIGDDLVSEGATVQSYRVRKIQTDRVEFEKDGQTWVQKVQ